MPPTSVTSFLEKHPLQKLNFEDKDIEYISCGLGKRAVLLLPGGGQTAQSNFGLIELLEKKYRVICPTIFDFGSVEQFCTSVNALLDHEQIKTVSIYGLSMGGLMAQSYLFRNTRRVEKLILSHACTPASKVFRYKVIWPLKILNVVLPLIPPTLIKGGVRMFAGRAQGVTKISSARDPWLKNSRNQELLDYFGQEWLSKYLDKTLLTTWINLDVGFSNDEFNPGLLSNWKGKILILNTDNDPLVGVDGNFKILYPRARFHMFHNTGHLTFHYQFTKVAQLVLAFLRNG